MEKSNIETPKTFKNLIELSNYFTDETICRKYIEKLIWNGKPVCLHCGNEKVYTFKDGKRYKCANNKCYSIFNVTVGTYLENTKIPLRKWLHAIYVFTSHKKGISSHQLAKDISVSQKSAWFLLSRVREILKDVNPVMLTGASEIDETYVGGKSVNKHRSKIKYDAQGNTIEEKTPVIGIVERNGKSVFVPVTNANRKEIFPLIRKHIPKGSVMFTDSASLYHTLKKEYVHSVVNHSAGEYVNGIIHTNSVEAAFSHLKRGLIGIYHHASKKHLFRYCNEFAFRYNTRKQTEVERFDDALRQSFGRITWNELTGAVEK